MDVLVRNAEGNLSPDDRKYAASKLSKLDRYFHQAHKVEIVHREEKLEHRIEITVFADGFTLRGEEHDSSVRAAIDKVADKMENRLRRLKTRIIRNHRKKGQNVPMGLQEEHIDHHDDDHVAIKERKTFLLKHMAPEEAALQMEMVDHSFFIFRNENSGNVEVLYKKKDGKYGLLQPEG